jgi:excisionase family DNA binding protein
MNAPGSSASASHRPARQPGTSRVQVSARGRVNSRDSNGALDAESAALLRYEDVARLCGCSKWTVRAWTDAGKLPVVRLPGRLVRIRRGDLARFLEAHHG